MTTPISGPSAPRKMPVLPLDAYLSQEWFDREQESIFSKTWRFVGLAEDISEPGQYLSVQAGLNNILLVMGHDNRLRAFHNICRHRGTQLLRTAGRSRKAITCPYHDWTYDLEGRLISIPDKKRQFPDLDMNCMGLRKASIARWRGMLFVHPNEDAGPITEWFGEVEPHLGPHRPDDLVEYSEGRTHREVRANWKIVVENYIDIYHLAHLHSGTLGMYDHGKIQSGFVGPHFAFFEPLAAHYADDLKSNAAMPLIDHISEDRIGAYVPMLFPCLGLAETESSWSTFHVIPLSPEKSLIETRTKVMNVSAWEFQKQEWRSAGFWRKQIRGKYDDGPTSASDPSSSEDPMSSGDFMEEDIYACEQQQKSLRSPYFSVGASARTGEAAVREFQALVGRWVEGPRRG